MMDVGDGGVVGDGCSSLGFSCIIRGDGGGVNGYFYPFIIPYHSPKVSQDIL